MHGERRICRCKGNAKLRDDELDFDVGLRFDNHPLVSVSRTDNKEHCGACGVKIR